MSDQANYSAARRKGAAVSEGIWNAKRRRRANLPSSFVSDREATAMPELNTSKTAAKAGTGHGPELATNTMVKAVRKEVNTNSDNESSKSSSRLGDEEDGERQYETIEQSADTDSEGETTISEAESDLLTPSLDGLEAPSLHLVLDAPIHLQHILSFLSPHEIYYFRKVHPGRFTSLIGASPALQTRTFFLSNRKRPSMSTSAMQFISYQMDPQGTRVIPGSLGSLAVFQNIGPIELNPLLFSGRNKVLDDVSFYENEAAGCFEVRFLTHRDISALAHSDSHINTALLTQPPTNRLMLWVRGHQYHRANKGMETTFFGHLSLEDTRGVRFGQILREAIKSVKKEERHGARCGQEIVYEVQFPKGYKVRMGRWEQIGTPLLKEQVEEL